MRLREVSDTVPKPMVRVGYRPILWHVMKYYALHGHTDFVLCLGFGADVIKQFFLAYEEADSNDFVLMRGSKNMLATDIDDWAITFVDTGLHAVRSHLQDDEVFLANYADGVTDLDLREYVNSFQTSGRIGGLLAVRPPQSYHVVEVDDGGKPTDIGPINRANLWLNAGYFVFRNEIFDYLERHDDIAGGVLPELIKDGQLYVHRYEGFWSPMDTFKDKTHLDAIWESGLVPWLSNPDGSQ
jgi:glucose-1-phosphate cytidylyltransferase